MATISTDTYLDGGTAITAGETWTINGCKLTVRTDTRWHANAPASMTGSFGTITGSSTQGGKLLIDATKVRWMPFDTGSGNVPAIGTTITQGGVSGYLLGVWASYTASPTAVGAAMPASGYLKFREVTGGQFAVGALTGIGANATEADRTGWIEFVGEQNSTIGLGQLGEFITRGDWFYHETLTSGSAHQFIQFPTNGCGTTGNNIHAVQIETAPGSGVFKWWHGIANPSSSGDSMYSTSIIGTDERSRYFKSLPDGTIQLGGDGTNLIGYVPPAGCKIRIPNIIVRVVATGAKSTNVFNHGTFASLWTGVATNTKTIDWQFLLSTFSTLAFSGTNTLAIDNCALYSFSASFDNIRTSGSFTNSSANHLTGANTAPNFRITNTTVPFSVDNVFITDSFGISGTGTSSGVSNSSNLTLSNIEFNMISTWMSEHSAMAFDGMNNSTMSNIQVSGANTVFTNCFNCSLTNFDYCIRVKGPITAAPTNRQEGITVSNCGNFKIDGYTVGKNGAFTNLQPYNTYVTISATAGPNFFRNFGSRSSFLPAGSVTTYRSNYLFEIKAGSNDVKIQRCYIADTRTGILNFSGPASTDRLTVDSVMGPYTKSIGVTGKNASFKGLSGAPDTTADGYYGTHFADYFISDTTSALVWYGVQPSASTSGENYLYSPTESAKYLAPAAQVLLNTVGDYFYSEMTYFVKGHTSFRNVAPTITGTNTNLVTYEYQLYTGAGYGGTWKTLNTTNLLAETISETGFKMKFRGTLTSAGTAQITSIQVFTSTTVQAQTNNLYVLDTAGVTLTGLAIGSEVRAYVGTDPATAVEVGGTESTGGSTYTFQHAVAGQDGYIMILAMGYQPVRIPYTYKSVDDSILIQPVIDRNYNNPV